MFRPKLLKTQQWRNRGDSTIAELPQPSVYELAEGSGQSSVEMLPNKEKNKRRRCYCLVLCGGDAIPTGTSVMWTLADGRRLLD